MISLINQWLPVRENSEVIIIVLETWQGAVDQCVLIWKYGSTHFQFCLFPGYHGQLRMVSRTLHGLSDHILGRMFGWIEVRHALLSQEASDRPWLWYLHSRIYDSMHMATEWVPYRQYCAYIVAEERSNLFKFGMRLSRPCSLFRLNTFDRSQLARHEHCTKGYQHEEKWFNTRYYMLLYFKHLSYYVLPWHIK